MKTENEVKKTIEQYAVKYQARIENHPEQNDVLSNSYYMAITALLEVIDDEEYAEYIDQLLEEST